MQLVLLGLVFVIGLFIYYLFSTRGGSSDDTKDTKKDDDLKREENVIFLPDDLEKIKSKHKKNRSKNTAAHMITQRCFYVIWNQTN